MAGWYLERGYEVLARNWRSSRGEIDLVVGARGVLVFCEVKTRSSGRFGQPFEAVTRAKQVRLRQLAAEWLRSPARPRRDGPAPEIRFDVASVGPGGIDVIEGAF